MSSKPTKRVNAVTKRLLRRWLRRLSLRARALLLVAFGFILGLCTQYVLLEHIRPLLFGPRRAAYAATVSSAPFATAHIALNDHYAEARGPSFAFFFVTGRSATQHLSLALSSPSAPAAARAYITHEQEHATLRTKHVVHADYRALAAAADEAAFNRSALQYVRRTKLPFYRQLLRAHNAKRLVYTGHVPLAFGLAPSLVHALPPGSLRLVRVRRDRIATAVSLMALGPSEEDPWGATPAHTDPTANLSSFGMPPPTVNSRWFPRPTDAFVRLRVSPQAWRSLNRFQRWLWYVDDVECRWQALVHALGDQFSWMEDSVENLSAMDGGRAWKRLAHFIGVDVDWNRVATRDNSIQHKKRLKIDASESQLREWDVQYRKLVGKCSIAPSLSYGWQDLALHKI